MDPQAPVISTEQAEQFETMLQQMDPLLVQGYRKFLHEEFEHFKQLFIEL